MDCAGLTGLANIEFSSPKKQIPLLVNKTVYMRDKYFFCVTPN